MIPLQTVDYLVPDTLLAVGVSVNWNPDIVTGLVLGDGLLGLVLLIIPLVILVELRRRRMTMPAWAAGLVAAMLFACSVNQWLDLYVLFRPAYWVMIIFKNISAILGVFTLVMLVFARPRSDLLHRWWLTARLLKHDQANLRQMIVFLCQKHGEAIPVWKDLEQIPPDPEPRTGNPVPHPNLRPFL